VLGIISATWRTVLDVMGSRSRPPQPGPDAIDGDPASDLVTDADPAAIPPVDGDGQPLAHGAAPA
jgi:hypothetical protein